MYVLVYTVLMDEVDGLMINAFRMTHQKKKNQQGKNNLWYCFKTSPQKKIGGGETGVGREKGRALQSKLFLKFCWFRLSLYMFAAR